MASATQIAPKERGLRCCSNIRSMLWLLLAALLIAVVCIHRESKRWIDHNDDDDDQTAKSSLSNCNLFSGKWVYDDNSHPLYREQTCSFKFDGLACERSGRKNLRYQHWRWQPNACDLPRFNAMKMVESLRNKRFLFVGDSLTRSQWASMACLLESPIPSGQKSVYPDGSLAVFKMKIKLMKGYNATVEHYWAPYLVESSSDHPIIHSVKSEQIVRVKAIEKHGKHWRDADILVFNTFLWWRSRTKFKVLWGSFKSPNKVYEEIEMHRAVEMALDTWSDWLETHVNPSKTKIYWVSMSPTHERGEEWGRPRGETCYNETEPIWIEGYQGSESDPRIMQLVEAAIDRLGRKGLKVQLINITQLSEYRKDAHTSINRKYWGNLTEEQLADPRSYADCVHWCVPGLPDVWNELLYAYIFHF
ncbi:protein trichome birefringence-like 34 [Diospyros lotus]|uniref:protein trichome birefringence-like 34 n=1 Tax=Diospyros lotus TaxID=55363 RepID=UPI0022558886|nr:protein trichome birefringence-like 34 [Diospyros lotus]